MTRRLLVLTRSVVAASLAFSGVACGGAEKQDVLEAPAATTGTSSSASSTSSSGGTSSGGSSASSTSSGGSTSSSGGAECPEEKEKNDDADDANTLETSICGVIEDRSDVDSLTFTLPASAKGVRLTYEGSVVLTVSVGGASSVTLKAGSTQAIPFVKQKPYLVQVRAEAAGTKWRVNLAVQ